MPTRPRYACRHPACNRPAESRGYCRDHVALSRAGSRPRASRQARGYDRLWADVRKIQLAAFPLCQDCEDEGRVEAAVMVDHVVPIRVAPERRLELGNLRSLCWKCHGRKSAADKAKYPDHYNEETKR